jgi:hypothetical protein
MWQNTQYLKNRLSLGQAFWLGQSCSSYIGFATSCLPCSEDPEISSPCPSFSVGEQTRETACKVCSTKNVTTLVAPKLEELKKKARATAQIVPLGDRADTIYCSFGELKDELGKRYSELKRHARRRKDLELGAVLKWEFEDHWIPDFQLREEPEPVKKPSRREQGKNKSVQNSP